MCLDIIPNTSFHCKDLPELGYLQEQILQEVNKKHEELIKAILMQILNREVVPDDARDLTIIRYPGDIMDYDLAWRSVKIGRVKFHTEMAKISIEFIPTNDNL